MPFGDAAGQGPPPPALRMRAAESRVWTCLPLLAAVAALWMATRPYSGVVHDARLYALQALSAGDPAPFADDLFLRFGSQDRFTVFSGLYGPVLRWAGVSLGAMLLTLLGQATWLCGAYCLARALLGDPVRALAAVAGLVALPNTYGARFIFGYGEQFLTPRLFAEALTMFALGRAVLGAPVSAAASLAAAVAFHPVMALPGAAALFVHKALGNPAWWAAAACAGIAACGLAALGVEPFVRLGVRFDPTWFEIVSRRVAYAFVGEWSTTDWSVLAGPAALAVLALAMLRPERRRAVAAVLVTAAVGVGLSFVGADLARNQFFANIQPWRATWLLGVTGNLMAAPLLARLAAGWERTAREPAGVALAAGIGVLALARLLPSAHAWSAALLTSAVVLSLRRGEIEPIHRVLVAAAVAAAAMSAVYFGHAAANALEALPEEHRAQLLSFSLCISGLGLVAAVLRSGPKPDGRAPDPALAAAAGFLLFCAALGWDQRTAWTKFVEAPDALPSELAAFVPGDAAVYWSGGAELLWLRLRRSSYHSCLQGAGVMFFRDTALAYRHRSESVRFEMLKSERCGTWPDDGRWPPPTRAELQRACVREPGLGAIVLPHRVDGVPHREWVPPVKFRSVWAADGQIGVQEFDRFYAYACDALR